MASASFIIKTQRALRAAISERDRLLRESAMTDGVCVDLARVEDRIIKLKARMARVDGHNTGSAQP
jgi:hypothetical protein